MLTELLNVLELTDVVYKNNYTTESNYCYFLDKQMWTSNTTGENIAENEVILFHKFSENLSFNNLGIPSQKFLSTLKALSENVEIIQKEDHILLIDGKKRVKIPTVKYVEPPCIDTNDLDTTKIVEMKELPKNFLQFVDKTDVDGGRVHFIQDRMYSTDVNSIYDTSSIVEVGDDFSVPIPIFNSMLNFDSCMVDDYLYLVKGATIAVTKYYPPMDVSVLEELGEEGCRLEIPKIIDEALFKIFNSNTKKPDRMVRVDIGDGTITIESGNDTDGVVLAEGEIDADIGVSFTCNADKFVSLVKDAVGVYLWDEVLECVYENGIRYIVVEVE